jgi:hypothetical protein
MGLSEREGYSEGVAIREALQSFPARELTSVLTGDGIGIASRNIAQ